MDLGSREGSRGVAAKSGLVTASTAAKGVNGERGAGVRDVVRGNEGGELLVGRKDLVWTVEVICSVRRFLSASEKLAGNFFRGGIRKGWRRSRLQPGPESFRR